MRRRFVTPALKEGTVFRIPIDETRCGYGQVRLDLRYVATGLWLVVYEPAFLKTESPPLSDLTMNDILLCGASEDALITHGRWPIIGVCEPDQRTVLPIVKIKVGDRWWIETLDRSWHRPASPADLDRYDFRTVTAPIRFQKALQAHHSVGDWLPQFNTLTCNYVQRHSLRGL
jgi:Immunity protein 26